MVSALFQSRMRSAGGTRDFVKGGTHFGWKTVQDLYKRELERIKVGQATRVPKLKESHIQCDSWTRLNVLPSKVMQVSPERLCTWHYNVQTTYSGFCYYVCVCSRMKSSVNYRSMPHQFHHPRTGQKPWLPQNTYLHSTTSLSGHFWGRKLVSSIMMVVVCNGLRKGFLTFKNGQRNNGAFNIGVDSKEFIAWQVWLLECKKV